MHLHFGLDFDSPVYRHPPTDKALALWMGPRSLLRWLEAQCGLSGFPENTDYLRIECYRQALLQYKQDAATPVFYTSSLDADRFATASILLAHRDALALGGWDFQLTDNLPERLAVFAEIELRYQSKRKENNLADETTGEADRWLLVLQMLQKRANPTALTQVILYESQAHLPTHIQRLFSNEFFNIPIVQAPAIETSTLVEEVIVLKARRDTDLAEFLSRTLTHTPEWRPVMLLPSMSRTLEQALLLQELPALGVPSASLGRPALQVLKLAPSFLWEPVDVLKIMEFVTLPVKPLDRGLALEIARVLSEKPGLFSDQWFGAVLGYLQKEGTDLKAREQYDFWFQRKRYPSDQILPKKDAIGLYQYLEKWARGYFEQSTTKDGSMLALAEQSRRICEILEMLPEERIGYLELERIVRTIYEPSPARFDAAEANAYTFIHQTGAIAAPLDELIWWDCVYQNESAQFDFWYPEERQWLQQNGCEPDHPQAKSDRSNHIRNRPLFACNKRLWLCLPERSNGTENLPNLILGDIEALREKIQIKTFHIDRAADRLQLEAYFVVPDRLQLPNRQATPARSQIEIPVPTSTEGEKNVESPTSLESLFYYPHRWYLRQKAGIYPSNLFSLKKDGTLQGNLAHRFFEMLLPLPLNNWTKDSLHEWVELQATELLEKEGATLLLYGREPERKAFLQKIKNAAWNLISLFKSNNWQVLHTEHILQGKFADIEVRGKSDLVLQRGQELAIIDLKWGGASYRKDMINNEEDLQLVLYAHLIRQQSGLWPHTGYFIIENGRMIARNTHAFKEALVAGKQELDQADVCQRILDRMEKTFDWRREQIRNGVLEIRTSQTAAELDDLYADMLLNLLEMKQTDAKWDDYRTLIEFG